MGCRPLVIAHRGASAHAPENTMAAFVKAVELGADGVELDVHMSADGELVVIHDEKIDRTSDGTGWIKDMTLEELRRFDMGLAHLGEHGRQAIPTLDQVLDLVEESGILLNIEIKSGLVQYPGIEEKIARALISRRLTERTIVSSFNHYSLVHLKAGAPDVRIGLLYGEALVDPWIYASRLGASAVHPLHYAVFDEMVQGCHKAGIAVNAWTVDTAQDLARMVRAGVDAIITNDPARARAVIAEGKE